MAVKDFTRHNDKLGFDYSVPLSAYYASYSDQFSISAYGPSPGKPGFLKEAAAFW
jgi:hypothetical protein